MTQDHFLELIGAWIRRNKNEDIQVTADTELLGTGLLDSFDFLDLIVYIEAETGSKVDLAVADPADFAVVRGLMRLTLGDVVAPSFTSATNDSTVPSLVRHR
jgi:acyl carrier protein